MAPPQWAYQVENFVTKPDEELICSVCHSVFCNPVMSPCDHVFCKACITKWLQNNRNCPICRKRVPRYSIKEIVPIVRNLIMKLTLYCRNKDQGCEAQFSLESSESHLKECNFELLLCKNKPCKEKLFRKDLDKHETKDCPHRYIKCSSCGSKMSLLSDVKAHSCIASLHLRLKRKNALIKKKNERIKQLKDEIKQLKETPSVASQSSVSSGFSPDRIRINIAESITSDSNDSSDSYIAILANSDSYSSDGNQSELFEGFLNSVNNRLLENSQSVSESNNAESTGNDVENETNHGNDSSPENNAEQEQNSAAEDRSQRRRPHKRRLPRLYSSSDDEADSEDRRSWSSPKRQWLSSPIELGSTSSEAAARNSGDSVTEAGTSASFAAEGRTSSEDSNSNTELQSNAEQSARTTRQQAARVRKTDVKSKSSRGRAVFQNTLALLEQYNLESDPEWLPQYASHRGDTPSPSESESSYDDLDVLNDTSSSFSDFEDN